MLCSRRLLLAKTFGVRSLDLTPILLPLMTSPSLPLTIWSNPTGELKMSA